MTDVTQAVLHLAQEAPGDRLTRPKVPQVVVSRKQKYPSLVEQTMTFFEHFQPVGVLHAINPVE